MNGNDFSSTPNWNARAGETIIFGSYPQRAAGKGKRPITWRVLQNSGSELFVLSEYILDCKRYHSKLAAITWRDSDIRRWLNREFYDAAFSADEQKLITMTQCKNNGINSPDTEDRIFLLSVEEIQTFTDSGDGIGTQIRRRTVGTDFAKAPKPDGCSLYVYDKGVEKDYIVENGKKLGCSWWWTRSQLQPEHPSRATFIGPRSNVKRYGEVNLRFYGVRPALNLLTATTIQSPHGETDR